MIEKWEAIQEQIMRQKSRANWIQLGDHNTKCFHTYMKSRQARNKVSCILTEDQLKLTDPQQKQQHFTQFFQELLGTAATQLPGIDITLARDGPCLTLHHQQQLMAPVTEHEIHHIVQKLPQDKTPGIDGYPAKFLKEFWPTVGGCYLGSTTVFPHLKTAEKD